MSTIYVVQHVRDEDGPDEDVKMIGVYSTPETAAAAVERLKGQPGFSDWPKGFHVDAYPVDQDHWAEGFVDL